MHRMATIVAFVAVVWASPAHTQGQSYGWTISNSNTNPLANSGSVTGGPQTLYLWLNCATPEGMTAAEFDLQLPGGVVNFGFNPQNGFLNAGTSGSLMLAVGACPTGPVIAGSWNVFNSIAGDYCLVASGGSGQLTTVDCDVVTPTAWPVTQRGYGTGGVAACTQDLCVVSVEPTTWGQLKTLYR